MRRGSSTEHRLFSMGGLWLCRTDEAVNSEEREERADAEKSEMGRDRAGLVR